MMPRALRRGPTPFVDHEEGRTATALGLLVTDEAGEKAAATAKVGSHAGQKLSSLLERA